MSFLQSFFRSQDGNVLIMTGASLMMLLGVAGAGVDLGRQQLLRNKLQQATDAAIVAASFMPEGTTNAEREDAARRYFALNFPDGYLDVSRPTPNVSITANGAIVEATVNSPTRFISFVGINNVQSTGRTVLSKNVATSAPDYDVVAVIDESGSTSAGTLGGTGSRMDQEKEALRNMIEGMFPAGAGNPKLRFGMVGYTGYISNVGPLTSNRATALSYIDRLAPRCHNYDHYGLEAGLNMITGRWTSFSPVSSPCPPNWSSVQRNVGVPPAATPRDDGKQLSDAKHLVFITDGYIMVEPPGCPGTPCYADFLEQCEAIKNAGVVLYTISFASQTEGDSNTLKSCASLDGEGQPRYFFAPSASVLADVLSGVGETIRSIRITD